MIQTSVIPVQRSYQLSYETTATERSKLMYVIYVQEQL